MIAKSEQHRILWLPGEERMWDEDAGSRSSAGVRISPDNALMVSTVFACIRVLAEAVATPTLHVLERMADGSKRRATELPLYRKLNLQPNGWQTSFEWRCQLMLHAGLYNVAYCEIVPGQSGAVDQLIPLHPSRMKVERLENGKLRYKYREEKGVETIYSQEQILAIRGLTEDGINGLSPVETCKDAIALARAYELHGARYFAAGARPGFVLSTEGQLNSEARETLANQWDRRHGGVGNSHRTAVLTGGLKPFEIPQNTNTDSQWLEGRRFQIAEICRLWRVPMSKIQSDAGTPPGNTEQASQEFLTDTIMPWLRRFESAFTRDLIAEDDRFEASFDTRFMLRADSSSRSTLYRQLWDLGVYSTNDIRAEEGLNPVEGGDVRYRPLNMGTLGQEPTATDVLAQQQPGSGIDGQAVEGGLAVAEGQPQEPAAPDTSLTTAEVSSLLTVVKQITDGLLTVDAARAIIAAAFPVLSSARVETILEGVAVKKETPVALATDTQPPPPAGRSLPVAERDCGTGAGGFKPGNKCAGGGDGGGSDGGGSSSGSAGDDSVDTAGGGSDGPAHAEGSKAYKQREANRQSRKTGDYSPTRADASDTSDRHTVTPRYGADGRYIAPTSPDDWTPERQAMHRQIVADATANVPASQEPTFYMMGGGPASGKSSIIKSGDVKHPERHVLANPDDLKMDIPEYRDGLASMDPKAAANAHEESSYLNKRVMAAAREQSQDVVWDGTGNHSIEKLESQVKPFRDAGYKVQADYVTCDADVAVARSQAAAKNPKSDRFGREVPEGEIRRTHASVSQIWPEAVRRGLFDKSDLYDTSAGGKPIRIASARGTKLTIHDRAAYQRFLDKSGGTPKRTRSSKRSR